MTTEHRVGHFTLLEPLGRGGMGEVYKARDERLGRIVAIKTLRRDAGLDATLRSRLLGEARAASALNHPNIVTVFEVGQDAQTGVDYIAMEHVDGEPLSALLARGEHGVGLALRVGLPLASALAAAHAAGIVHRDLKPANVMLGADGTVKLLDFGLAKQARPRPAADDPTQPPPLTGEGFFVGTPAYMAPEQFEGRKVDARTDVFAFGLLLHELASGKRAFQGDSDPALLASILRDPPTALTTANPQAPAALGGLVADCLQKDPARRPDSAAEVLARLREIERGGTQAQPRAPVATRPLVLVLLLASLAAFALAGLWWSPPGQVERPPPTASAERPGIAVLAFDTLGVEANRPFAGGLHEAVLGELASLSGLRVIARTSVLRFADAKPDLREVGRILDVPYILEGSVLREGGRLRVHAQLIDAASNAHLWSETYDRSGDDVFGVQTALARDIAARLKVSLLPAEAGHALPTRDPEAYRLYLEGLDQATAGRRLLQGNGGLAELQAAIARFDAAIARDPAFARAHAARADALLEQWWSYRDSGEAPVDAREQALLAVTEALKLAPDLGEAHRTLGLYHYWGHFDFDKADREFRRARELLPNDPRTLMLHGFMRRRQGDLDGSATLLEAAVRLDPDDPQARAQLTSLLFYGRRYREVRALLDDLLPRFPDQVELITISAFADYCRNANPQALHQAVERLGERPPRDFVRWLAATVAGDHRAALAAIAGLDEFALIFQSTSISRAISLHALGEHAAAADAVADYIHMREQRLAQQPDRPGAREEISVALALAGRGEDARRMLAAHLASSSRERSALEHADAIAEAAIVHAILGESEAAIGYLEQHVDAPRGECGAFMRRWPVFAALREDPRFEALARRVDWPQDP